MVCGLLDFSAAKAADSRAGLRDKRPVKAEAAAGIRMEPMRMMRGATMRG
jgi:hypothetical protein